MTRKVGDPCVVKSMWYDRCEYKYFWYISIIRESDWCTLFAIWWSDMYREPESLTKPTPEELEKYFNVNQQT